MTSSGVLKPTYFHIVITLSDDRTKPGELKILDEKGNLLAGPFSALGLADLETAVANCNSSRNPISQFGNTPLGKYFITHLKETGPETKLGQRRSKKTGKLSYGHQGAVVLSPVEGQALDAVVKGGRSGIWIHAGDLASDGSLRPTAGCIRVSPSSMISIVNSIKEYSELHQLVTGDSKIITGDVTISSLIASNYSNDDVDDPPPRECLKECKDIVKLGNSTISGSGRGDSDGSGGGGPDDSGGSGSGDPDTPYGPVTPLEPDTPGDSGGGNSGDSGDSDGGILIDMPREGRIIAGGDSDGGDSDGGDSDGGDSDGGDSDGGNDDMG